MRLGVNDRPILHSDQGRPVPYVCADLGQLNGLLVHAKPGDVKKPLCGASWLHAKQSLVENCY